MKESHPDTMTAVNEALFQLPPTAQRQENLCSMVNFFPQTLRLLDAGEIHFIAEIGCESGAHSRALADYIRTRGGKVIFVDPVATDFLDSMAKQPFSDYHQMLSGEYLPAATDIECFFLDGDHNYETMFSDLTTLAKTAEKGVGKVAFLHDVSWPWARRDLYYDVSRIANPLPCGPEITVSPFIAGDAGPDGLPPNGYWVSTQEGGPHNGVLTAVEDFLKTDAGENWRLVLAPVFYGIGILYRPDRFTTATLPRFEREIEMISCWRDILATLEYNRITNLCHIQSLGHFIDKIGAEWHANQSYIKESNNRLYQSDAAAKKYYEAFAAAENSRKQAEAEIESLKTSQSTLEEECIALQEQYAELLHEEQRHQEELESCKEELTLAAADTQRLHAEINALTESVKSRETALAAALSERDTNRKMLQEKDSALQTTQELLAAKSSELNVKINELDSWREQAENAIVDREQYQKELQTALSELETQTDECTRLHDRLQAAAVRQQQTAELAAQLEKHNVESARQAELLRGTIEEQQKLIVNLQDGCWARDRELRELHVIFERNARPKAVRALEALSPASIRHRRAYRHLQGLVDSQTIKVFSVDLFDTLLIRGIRPEAWRFQHVANLLKQQLPPLKLIPLEDIVRARARAHFEGYRLAPVVQGCKEGRMEDICTIFFASLGLEPKEERIREMIRLDLEFEVSVLRPNKRLIALLRTAHSRGIRIVGTSDMYHSGESLQKLCDRVAGPCLIDKVYSSADFGVSKSAGLLFERVVSAEKIAFSELMHCGDNFQSDFAMPYFRYGIPAEYLPRHHFFTTANRIWHKYLTRRILLERRAIP